MIFTKFYDKSMFLKKEMKMFLKRCTHARGKSWTFFSKIETIFSPYMHPICTLYTLYMHPIWRTYLARARPALVDVGPPALTHKRELNYFHTRARRQMGFFSSLISVIFHNYSSCFAPKMLKLAGSLCNSLIRRSRRRRCAPAAELSRQSEEKGREHISRGSPF